MDTEQPVQRGASEQAIQHHYDIGNEFYQLWLDPTMTYTCALWGPDDDLQAAQLRKIDHYAAAGQLRGVKRVLDVGSGWGGALHRLRAHWGVDEAVGLTLSAAQQSYCKTRYPELDIRLQDWADHEPEAPYDGIVSVEAFEAFARPGLARNEKISIYRGFFERCHRWLKPGGSLSIQVIAYGNAGPEHLDSFISQRIFPESDLPRLSEIFQASERLFEPVQLLNHREHYVSTLKQWRAALREHRGRAALTVGEETLREYQLYLRLSEVMFRSGTCDLLRLTLRRVDSPRLPVS